MTDNSEWKEKILDPKGVDQLLKEGEVGELRPAREYPPRHPQDEKLKQERDEWKTKYEQVFQEQCTARSQETQLKGRIQELERTVQALRRERDRLEATVDGLDSVNERIMTKLLDRIENK